MADPGGARSHAALACTAGLVAALAASDTAAAGQVRELVREATPLVLKDGRIAHVAIWSVPFRPGATELDGEVKGELAGLVETLATDCFLTAQAIGHVEPEAAKSGESLAAHRLARARADRIQQAMVERGLQASAIASVWDWQFLVKEPRVTVWVFRLHEGDDCEGKRLERPAATPAGSAAAPPGARELPLRTATPPADRQPAAATAPSAPLAPPGPQGAQAKAGAAARPAGPGTSPPSTVAAAPSAASSPPTRPMPGSTPPPRPGAAVRPPTTPAPPSLPGASASASEVLVSPLEAQGATGPADVSGAPPSSADAAPPPSAPPEHRAARAEPAGAPAEPSKSEAGPTKAAVESPPPDAGRTAIAALGPVPPSAAPGSLELVFDTNSSYLPKGAVAELRAFLKALPAGTPSEVELVAAVGGADVKESSGASGVRYNRWLAERRLNRVADWLKENAGGRRLKITTGYQEDDPSRRVTLRARAGG